MRFRRDSSGRGVSVQVGATTMPRLAIEPAPGVTQLKITVSSELLDLGNHVVLADAKVSK